MQRLLHPPTRTEETKTLELDMMCVDTTMAWAWERPCLLPCLALALFGSCLIRQLLNLVTVLLGWGHRDMLLLMPVTLSL